MNLSLPFALTALLIGAVVDLAYKIVQNRGINSSGYVLYQTLLFSAGIWVIIVFKGQLGGLDAVTWGYGLPFGLVAFLGILLFVMSMKEGSAGVNVPIFRLSFIVTAIGAFIFLQESLSITKAIGIVSASISVVSLSNISALMNADKRYLRSMLYLAGAVVFMGAAGVLNKAALDQGSLTVPLIAASNVTFTPAALIAAVATKGLKPNRTTLQFAPVTGLLQLAWALLITESLQTGDASINFPIVNLSFILTALLAVMFLKEPLHRWLVFGLAAAVVAVVAFGFS